MIRNSFFNDLLHLRSEGFGVIIPGSHWCFADHVVRGHRVLPAVAYLEMVLAGIARTHPTFTAAAIEDCFWMRPLVGAGSAVLLCTTIRQVGRRLRFDIADADQAYACGWVGEVAPTLRTEPSQTRISNEVAARAARTVPAASAYATFERMGINYGPEFRNIHEVKTAGLVAIASIEARYAQRLKFSTLLDCAFQSGMIIGPDENTGSLMPFSLGCLILHGGSGAIEQGTYFAATEKLTECRTNIVISKDNKKEITVVDLGVKKSTLK